MDHLTDDELERHLMRSIPKAPNWPGLKGTCLAARSASSALRIPSFI